MVFEAAHKLMEQGGGVDCDDAFKWMIERSDQGDFVIIRSHGTDAYNQYVMDLSNSTLNSVFEFYRPFLNRKIHFRDRVPRRVRHRLPV